MVSRSDLKLSAGRVVFATAATSLGVVSLLHRNGLSGFEPVPAMPVDDRYLGVLTCVVLLLAGVGLVGSRTARVAAISVGLVMLVWVLLFHLPNLVQHPRDGRTWTITFESVALCGVAWLLSGDAPGRAASTLRRAGMLGFALSLPVFGALHFVYAEFVATLIPEWIPARLFWAWFTGVAFWAAGASIAIGVMGRLAAILLGIMFGLWVLVLHIPRALAKSEVGAEWTSLFIALAMCGGAWLVAEEIRRTSLRPRP